MLRLCVAVFTFGLLACDMPVMGAPADGGGRDGDMALAPDGGAPPVGDLRINQMQMRATVNSYHEFVFDQDPAVAWRHPDVNVQAEEQGIRVFDFDISGDRQSWFDLHPATHEFPFDHANNCGWRISDNELYSGDLGMCLRDLQGWCDANPEHPLLVLLIGETDTGDRPPQMIWQLDDLESSIQIGLSRDRLLVPADVRGEHATLWDAIQADGWPTVDETRGKVMIVLNDRGPMRFAYLMNGGLDPADPLMFVAGDPEIAGQDGVGDEVFFSFEPTETYDFETDMARIEQMGDLIRRGFLVHAITDDPDKAEVLRGAGVHFVGTRFPDAVFGPVDGSPTLCNPETAPDWCLDEMFEPRR